MGNVISIVILKIIHLFYGKNKQNKIRFKWQTPNSRSSSYLSSVGLVSSSFATMQRIV